MHLPDELQHIQEHLNSKYAKFKKGVIVSSFVTAALLAVTLVFVVQSLSDSQSQTLKTENIVLKEQNMHLEQENQKLRSQISSFVEQNKAIEANISELQTSINGTAEQIEQLQSIISQKCDLIHQKLSFNQTRLKDLTLSIQSPSFNAKNTQMPAIQYLNLSGNSLTKFSDNSLPGLISLDLSNNYITIIANNKLDKVQQLILNQEFTLKQFRNNVIPLITSLNLSNNGLTVFKENILHGIKSLNLNNNKLTELSGCEFNSLQSLSFNNNSLVSIFNNTFPLLNAPSGFLIKTFTDNYFGNIERLTLTSQAQALNFERNTLLSTTKVYIYYSVYDFSTLKTNKLPLLRDLMLVNCNLTNFEYQQQFRLLENLTLYQNMLGTKISNHEYPNLKTLTLKKNGITEFSGNKLPALESLFIDETQKMSAFCNDNLMINLKQLDIINTLSIVDYSCLSKLQALSNLKLSNINSNFTFDGYHFPLLQELQIEPVSSFRGNELPMLRRLNLVIPPTGTAYIDFRPFQATLEILAITGFLDGFDRLNFPKLRQFIYLKREDSRVTFINCDFPLLEVLVLNRVYTNSVPLNTYGSLREINIQFATPFPIDYNSNPNLEVILIRSVTLNRFSGCKLPKLKAIELSDNNLTQFVNNQLLQVESIYLFSNLLVSIDCSGFPGVNKLFLDRNLITDAIADVLISCNFTALKNLSLEDNKLQNRTEVARKLSQKYPNALIKT